MKRPQMSGSTDRKRQAHKSKQQFPKSKEKRLKNDFKKYEVSLGK